MIERFRMATTQRLSHQCPQALHMRVLRKSKDILEREVPIDEIRLDGWKKLGMFGDAVGSLVSFNIPNE